MKINPLEEIRARGISTRLNTAVSRRKKRLTRVLTEGKQPTTPLVRESPEEDDDRADDVECQPDGSEVFLLNEFTSGPLRSFDSSTRSYYPTDQVSGHSAY